MRKWMTWMGAAWLASSNAVGAGAAWAQDDEDLQDAPREEAMVLPARGLSIGPRATWFQPDLEGPERDRWYGGLQVRLHFTPMWAFEASGDYRRRRFPGTRVDIFPVQGSLMAYPFPNRALTPYLLAGGGWYFTHVEGPGGLNRTEHRFGPHAGGGLELHLNEHWSLDAGYRHVWVEDIRTQDASLLDKDFNDAGHMGTAAINYHF